MKTKTRARIIIIAVSGLIILGIGSLRLFSREYQFNHWIDKPQLAGYKYNLALSHNGKWFVFEIAPYLFNRVPCLSRLRPFSLTSWLR